MVVVVPTAAVPPVVAMVAVVVTPPTAVHVLPAAAIAVKLPWPIIIIPVLMVRPSSPRPGVVGLLPVVSSVGPTPVPAAIAAVAHAVPAAITTAAVPVPVSRVAETAIMVVVVVVVVVVPAVTAMAATVPPSVAILHPRHLPLVIRPPLLTILGAWTLWYVAPLGALQARVLHGVEPPVAEARDPHLDRSVIAMLTAAVCFRPTPTAVPRVAAVSSPRRMGTGPSPPIFGLWAAMHGVCRPAGSPSGPRGQDGRLQGVVCAGHHAAAVWVVRPVLLPPVDTAATTHELGGRVVPRVLLLHRREVHGLRYTDLGSFFLLWDSAKRSHRSDPVPILAPELTV
mmetsp:Transcript_11061/g.33776  ORF Transcript_11061/g.33776 Transcript_11061/m.33776 type:complete len:340 (+) Transcript_11061:2214-3233(+)